MIVSEKQKEVLPKVCVIIPAYNRAEFIRETIDSVLNQTYKNIELIVVDDGSTDCTMEILQEYKDRLVVLQHPGGVNKGQSAAINLGMIKSANKYVAILDSDDLFAPEKIQLQVEFLEKHPYIGLVYGNGYAINERGKKIYSIYEFGHCEHSDPELVLMDCYFSLPSNSMVRRNVLEEVGGFDEALRSAQDHDMAIRIAEVSKLAYLDKKLFYYRRHGNSISAKNAFLRWKNGFVILDKACGRYNYSTVVVRKRKAVLHYHLGQCYIKKKQIVRALFHFISAGIFDPGRSLSVIVGKEQL